MHFKISLFVFLLVPSILHCQTHDRKFGKNGSFSLFLENDSLYTIVKNNSTGPDDIFHGTYTVKGKVLSLKSDSSIRVYSGYIMCDTSDFFSGRIDSLYISTTMENVELSESMHCKSLLYVINGNEYLYEALDSNQFDLHPIKIPQRNNQVYNIYFPEYKLNLRENCPEKTSSMSIYLFYKRSSHNISTYPGIPEKFKIDKKDFKIHIID